MKRSLLPAALLSLMLAGSACGLSPEGDPPDQDQAVPAEAPVPYRGGALRTLTVTPPTGGTITAPGGLSCPGTCSASYPKGSTVTLSATPAAGYRLGSWGGDCSGSSATCTLTMTSAKSVSATFIPQVELVVSTSGMGTVTATPPGGSCGAGCSVYDVGTVVTLTATPDAGATFTGWSGDCTGTSDTCTVVMDTHRAVNATFSAPSYAVTVAVSAPGNAIDVNGALCTSSCTYQLPAGTLVTLRAVPGSQWGFEQWGGVIRGSGNPVSFTLFADMSATATFFRPLYSTGVSRGGTLTLSGTFAGKNVSYTCDGDVGACAAGAAFSLSYDSTVTVTATLDTTGSGWFIYSWDGMADGAVQTWEQQFTIQHVGTESQVVSSFGICVTGSCATLTSRPYSKFPSIGVTFVSIIR